MHFNLKPTFSDQKEDFLNVSQFSDIISTLDEQNHPNSKTITLIFWKYFT